MDELPSKKSEQKPDVQVQQESISFQIDPKLGKIDGSAKGSKSTVQVLGILGLTCAVLYKWEALGVLSPFLIACAFMFLGVVIFRQEARQPRVHVTKNTLTLQGITEEALLRGGFVQVLIQWVSQRGSMSLPEPDARVDASSGKPVPFQPGEKEKILQEQKVLEAEVTKEISEITASEQIKIVDRVELKKVEGASTAN